MIAIATLAAVTVVALLLPGGHRRRWQAAGLGPTGPRVVPDPGVPSGRSWRRSSGLAGIAAAVAVVGLAGLTWWSPPVALVTGLLVRRWVDGLDSAADVRRREQMAHDLPLAADLLVAALGAGRPPGAALDAVAEALRGPLGVELGSVGLRLRLGSDPVEVWRTVARDPTLGPLGQAMSRSIVTGAPVAAVLGRCVDDLRRDRQARAGDRARTVGVRSAGPLGLCFLPAFICIGVVPTVISMFGQLLR